MKLAGADWTKAVFIGATASDNSRRTKSETVSPHAKRSGALSASERQKARVTGGGLRHPPRVRLIAHSDSGQLFRFPQSAPAGTLSRAIHAEPRKSALGEPPHLLRTRARRDEHESKRHEDFLRGVHGEPGHLGVLRRRRGDVRVVRSEVRARRGKHGEQAENGISFFPFRERRGARKPRRDGRRDARTTRIDARTPAPPLERLFQRVATGN